MGDINTLLAAISSPESDISEACASLQAYLDGGGADAVVDAGGANALATAFDTKHDEVSVAALCFLVEGLAVAVSPGLANSLNILVEKLLSTIHAVTVSAEVCQAACLALSNLSSCITDKLAVAAAVLSAMRAHTADTKVAEAASAALAAIAVDSDGQAALCAVGAVPLLVTILSEHVRVVAVVEQAAAAICAAAINKTNQASVVRSGGIAPLLQALGLHMTEPGVAETCCIALSNVVSCAEGAPALAAAPDTLSLSRALVLHYATEPVIVRQVRA